MGFPDHVSDLYNFGKRRRSKKKPMQTVDIKVKMDCDGCERRVKHAVSGMKVSGYVETNKVLKRVKSTGKEC